MQQTAPRPDSGIHVPDIVEHAGLEDRTPGRLFTLAVTLWIFFYRFTRPSGRRYLPPVELPGLGKRWPCHEAPEKSCSEEQPGWLELELYSSRRKRFFATRPMFIPRALRETLADYCARLSLPFWENQVRERTDEMLQELKSAGITSPALLRGGPQEFPGFGKAWWTAYRRDANESLCLYHTRKERDADYKGLCDLALLCDAGAPTPYRAAGRMLV